MGVYKDSIILFFFNVYLLNDHNALAYFSSLIPNLNKTLENESKISISWLKENNMTANPENFIG